LCINFWVLYFKNIELNLLAGELLKLLTENVSFLSAATDNDSWASSVKVDTYTITCAFDFDA